MRVAIDRIICRQNEQAYNPNMDNINAGADDGDDDDDGKHNIGIKHINL